MKKDNLREEKVMGPRPNMLKIAGDNGSVEKSLDVCTIILFARWWFGLVKTTHGFAGGFIGEWLVVWECICGLGHIDPVSYWIPVLFEIPV